MHTSTEFWDYLNQLIATHPWVIDRPKGSAHPRYPELIYPMDYGYLQGTSTLDGGGIDLWVGSLPNQQISGIAITVDLDKHDAEIKLLIACTAHETQTILNFLNGAAMRAILIQPIAGNDLNPSVPDF